MRILVTFRGTIGSAEDDHVIADVPDTDARPGGVDDRGMLGPGADVARKRDGAVAAAYPHVGVDRHQPVPVRAPCTRSVTSAGLGTADHHEVVMPLGDALHPFAPASRYRG
jgi:hypothetical protein